MALFRCGTCHAVYADHYPTDDTCINCKKGYVRIITPKKEKTNMTPITPELKLHTHQDNNGIHINSLIMRHKGNNYHLYAGTKETIYVFTESIALYVLIINKINGTIGLNAYMSPEPFPINSFYMHTLPEIIDVFGANWEQIPALDITMKLINYLM